VEQPVQPRLHPPGITTRDATREYAHACCISSKPLICDAFREQLSSETQESLTVRRRRIGNVPQAQGRRAVPFLRTNNASSPRSTVPCSPKPHGTVAVTFSRGSLWEGTV